VAGKVAMVGKEAEKEEEDDDLMARLAALRA
jgi:hypothetical protein